MPYTRYSILLTKITATENEAGLSYLRVQGLYFVSIKTQLNEKTYGEI